MYANRVISHNLLTMEIYQRDYLYKKQKDIMKESNVARDVAKSDIKSEIKRRVYSGGKKPSDFYPKPKGR